MEVAMRDRFWSIERWNNEARPRQVLTLGMQNTRLRDEVADSECFAALRKRGG
jgi:hypothetical protein